MEVTLETHLQGMNMANMVTSGQIEEPYCSVPHD